MKQRKPRNWTGILVILSFIAAFGGSVAWTNYVFSFVCDYIQIQVGAYEETPPSTPTGVTVRDSTREFLNKHCK